MTVAIIRYNAGNVLSVTHALRRLGIEPLVTDKAEEISAAARVVFPGVGEASSAMRYLRERGLDQVICRLTQPFLGICLGLQLMCERSEEGGTECLGLIPGKVVRFRGAEKVPHMGWNSLHGMRGPLFAGLPPEPYVYFVHSYYAELGEHTSAAADYGEPFSAALERDNFFAVQFHPEKSAAAGERILANFLGI